MRSNISGQIAKLPTLSRQRLLVLWQELFRKTAPAGIRRELMIPCLAYKMQENQFGGLKSATRAELRRMVRSLKRNPAGSMTISARLKPGTRLFRRWRGHMHEVIATESGYEYGGVKFNSLSEVARMITKTRWSGPAFFGLKRIQAKPGQARE